MRNSPQEDLHSVIIHNSNALHTGNLHASLPLGVGDFRRLHLHFPHFFLTEATTCASCNTGSSSNLEDESASVRSGNIFTALFCLSLRLFVLVPFLDLRTDSFHLQLALGPTSSMNTCLGGRPAIKLFQIR